MGKKWRKKKMKKKKDEDKKRGTLPFVSLSCWISFDPFVNEK